MFKTIVLALDGSEGSKRAIPFARDLARSGQARVVIVHVEELTIGKGGGPLRADEPEIRSQLDQVAGDLSKEGIESEVRVADVMIGGPAQAIRAIAEEVGSDLIVAGTRGHSPVSGLLLGSVTQRLLHIAHQPVLAVPPPR